MKYEKNQYPEVFKHTANNEMDILKSKKCSCLFCRQTYDARKVNDWSNDDNGVTALCPECGMDAVVGDASGFSFDHEDLKAINLAYFGEDYMHKHPQSAEKFVNRYRENKITHKKENENLYIKYLSLLASLQSSDAAYSLGELYEFGTEFTPKDPVTALKWYSSLSLQYDGDALTRLGVLHQSGLLGREDPDLAYQCFAKAMALGSMSGLLHFADCYLDGIHVRKDESYAYTVLKQIFPECYARFVLTTGKDAMVFASLCYRLGKLYEKGIGTDRNEFEAMRMYLFASFAFSLMAGNNLLIGDLLTESSDNNQRLNTLADLSGIVKGDPQFDLDTFSGSLINFGNVKDRYDLYVPNTFKPTYFDPESNVFGFQITYPNPALIVDVGNLFCGFVPGTIDWEFNTVEDVKFSQNTKAFNRVAGNTRDGYHLINTLSQNGEEEIGEIDFIETKDEEENVTEEDPKKKA